MTALGSTMAVRGFRYGLGTVGVTQVALPGQRYAGSGTGDTGSYRSWTIPARLPCPPCLADICTETGGKLCSATLHVSGARHRWWSHQDGVLCPG